MKLLSTGISSFFVFINKERVDWMNKKLKMQLEYSVS